MNINTKNILIIILEKKIKLIINDKCKISIEYDSVGSNISINQIYQEYIILLLKQKKYYNTLTIQDTGNPSLTYLILDIIIKNNIIIQTIKILLLNCSFKEFVIEIDFISNNISSWNVNYFNIINETISKLTNEIVGVRSGMICGIKYWIKLYYSNEFYGITFINNVSFYFNNYGVPLEISNFTDNQYVLTNKCNDLIKYIMDKWKKTKSKNNKIILPTYVYYYPFSYRTDVEISQFNYFDLSYITHLKNHKCINDEITKNNIFDYLYYMLYVNNQTKSNKHMLPIELIYMVIFQLINIK